MSELSTRRALIEATIESIHQHGMAGTTVGTVTDLAGVSRGMVRHVFSSKLDMLVAAMETLVEEWTTATAPAEGVAPEKAVVATVEAMFAPDVFTDARVAAWLGLSVEASTEPALRPSRERAQALWADQLEQSLAASGVDRPAERARAVLALADGLWLRHALEPDAVSRADAEATVVDVVEMLLSE